MNRSSFIRTLALPLLIAAALGATAQDKDWVFAATSDGSIAFEVPKGYMAANPNDPVFKKASEDIVARNPGLKNIVSDGPAKDQTLQMFDVSDPVDDGFLDNFNVITRNIPGLTVAMLPDVGDQMLAEMPKKDKGEHKMVDLPYGKALVYSCILDVKTETGSQGMAMLGYMFLKGEKTHVVTFGTAEGQMAKKRPIFEKIMKTARVTFGR